jgi:hypothetical protein
MESRAITGAVIGKRRLAGTGVWVKSQTVDVDRLVQITRDRAGNTLTRELCMFDVSGNTRVYLDWDSDAASREIKNPEGKWIQG